MLDLITFIAPFMDQMKHGVDEILATLEEQTRRQGAILATLKAIEEQTRRQGELLATLKATDEQACQQCELLDQFSQKIRMKS